MGFANRAICAAGLGFAVSALAACGSNGSLLSAGQSAQLDNQLSAARDALGASDCSTAARDISSFRNTVDNNLGGVDSTLVSNLQQGAQTIAQLAASDCPTQTKTVTTPAPKTTTSTTPKTTTSTTTTPTTTTPTTTTPTTTTPTTTIPTTTTPTTTTPGTGGAGIGGGGGP